MSFLIFYGCSKEDVSSNPIDGNSKDSVITICRPIYKKREYIQTTPTFMQEYKYDSLGRLTRYKSYRAGTLNSDVYYYNYDRYGNSTYAESFSNGALNTIYISKYCGFEKHLTTEVKYLNDSSESLQEWIYDSKGYLKDRRIFNGYDLERRFFNYNYDLNGNNIYYERFDKRELVFRYTQTFNQNNKLLTKITEDIKNNTEYLEEISYDSEGQVNRWKVYANGKLFREAFNYVRDDQGNAIYFEDYIDGKLYSIYTREYQCFEMKVN